MAETEKIEKITTFEEFEQQLKCLASGRNLKMHLEFYVSKCGYYRVSLTIENWEYCGLWYKKDDEDGVHRNWENGIATDSDNDFNSLLLKGYTDLTEILSDLFDEIKYVVNTYDIIKNKKENYERNMDFIF